MIESIVDTLTLENYPNGLVKSQDLGIKPEELDSVRVELARLGFEMITYYGGHFAVNLYKSNARVD